MLSTFHLSFCQGVAKSLHKECLAKMEPSKEGF